jgi:ethanolamine ammonia-lyase large subunit
MSFVMNREKLLELFVKANEFKEGDLLVGGTRDELERKDARQILSTLRLGDISKVDIVEDAVSEALTRFLNRDLAAEISQLSLNQLKKILLDKNGSNWIRRYSDGLTSEQIASLVKLMTNDELSQISRSIFNPLPGESITIGSPDHFGSRIQPNSPSDDGEEILFSVLEGLVYGCGDVILGVNPASDDVETIVRLERLLQGIVDHLALPSRYCVLSDIIKQTSARQRTRVDVGFQSLAGTSKALRGMVGLDVDGLLELARGFDGLYFETGQGSAVTNHAAEGVDMVTLEARNYGLARTIRRQTGSWMIVNDVAGFIGPEVFRCPDQLLRACLEDTVMAKLHGLSMGLDVCSTFHMGIDPETLRQITVQITAQAAPAYLMAVAGNCDPMLGYLTTSFREHPRLRYNGDKRVATEMHVRLIELGVMDKTGELRPDRPDVESLYAIYMKESGDRRSFEVLRAEAGKKMAALRERGFDLGYGHDPDYGAPSEVASRVERIYEQARRALYATLDGSVLRDASPRNLRISTLAASRDDYLSHPSLGERITEREERRMLGLFGTSRVPQVQIVISDGLNADAVNENLRELLPPLRHLLTAKGFHMGDVDIVVQNGRVRAGYHIGGLLNVDMIIHLIGERPGTGLNTLSAYLTYGRDKEDRWRWSPSMDHSDTNVICGISRQAKHPAEASREIAGCVARILRERKSGVELGRNA